jgi:hypothetical protein
VKVDLATPSNSFFLEPEFVVSSFAVFSIGDHVSAWANFVF